MKTIIVYQPDGDVTLIRFADPDRYGEGFRDGVFTEVREQHQNEETGAVLEVTRKVPVPRRPYAACPDLQRFINPSHPKFIGTVCEWEVVDTPPSKAGLESRAQLCWIEKGGKKIIHQDQKWAHQLMPIDSVKRRRVAALETQLDAELEKSAPDLVTVFRLSRKLEKCRASTCPVQHLEWAIEGLDERVAKGEPDKPKIRQRLQKRLAELRGA